MVFVDAQKYMKVQDDDLDVTFRTPKPSFEDMNIPPTSFKRHHDTPWWQQYTTIVIPASVIALVVSLCLALVVVVIIYSGPGLQSPLFTIPEHVGAAPKWRADLNRYVVQKDKVMMKQKTQERVYNFTLSEFLGKPDGVERMIRVINGAFPGPLVEANIGDTLKINLYNNMSYPSSIHWPGHKQNDQDGMPGITQTAIAPGASYVYQFVVQEVGTFLYYASYESSMADGLYGPMVIHDHSKDPHSASEDVVLLLSDWFETTNHSLMFTGRGDVQPDAVLISGYGKGDDVPSMVAQEDRDYRLRIINAGSSTALNVSLQSHTLTVIEADSTLVQSVGGLDSLIVEPGQRYSVLVEFDGVPAAYWLNVQTAEVNALGDKEETKAVGVVSNRMRIQYGDATHMVDEPLLTNPLDVTQLRPLSPDTTHKNAQENSSHTLVLDISSNMTKSFINKTSFITPTIPLLATLIQKPPTHDGILDTSGPDVLAYSLLTKEVVTLVVQNNADKSLPITLHGHLLTLIHRGLGVYKNDTIADADADSNQNESEESKESQKSLNMVRDVVTVPKGGYVVLQIQAGAPGVWALHTTDLWYREAGALMVLAIRDPGNATVVLDGVLI